MSESDRMVLLRNTFQAELAERYGESINDFIAKHAADFGQIVEMEPNIIQEYGENPEAAIEKIAPLLFH